MFYDQAEFICLVDLKVIKFYFAVTLFLKKNFANTLTLVCS